GPPDRCRDGPPHREGDAVADGLDLSGHGERGAAQEILWQALESQRVTEVRLSLVAHRTRAFASGHVALRKRALDLAAAADLHGNGGSAAARADRRLGLRRM